MTLLAHLEAFHDKESSALQSSCGRNLCWLDAQSSRCSFHPIVYHCLQLHYTAQKHTIIILSSAKHLTFWGFVLVL